jgi:FOG: TPR repeat, SEL1 subfamily
MRRWLIALVCFFFSSLPVAADNWLKALMLIDAGCYEEAIELLTPLAEDGNLEAQEILYSTYTHGYGVPVDQAKAFGWLQRGAEQGSARAQEAMGRHYLRGDGVAADEVQAVHWFRLAAQQGYPAAIYNLGVMTMHGQGVEADPEEAWRLIKRAAELDDPDALYVMGGVSLENAAVTGDVDTGLGYLSRAAELGQRRASALLGLLLEDLPEVPHHLVKSAFHYQMALAAGCDDIGDAAARAVARLSPDELEALDYNLALWAPDTDPRDAKPAPGPCLSK